MEFVSLGSVLAPTALAHRGPHGHPAPLVASWFAIGIIFLSALTLTDRASVFTRYAFLIGAILLASAFIPQTYLHRVPRSQIASASLVALVFSIGIVWLAARIALEPVERAVWWGPFGVILIAMLAWLSLGFILDWALWRLSLRPTFRRNRIVISGMRVLVIGFVAWRLMTGAFGDTAVTPASAEPAGPTLSAYLDDWLRARKDEAVKGRPYPVFIVTAEAAASALHIGRQSC